MISWTPYAIVTFYVAFMATREEVLQLDPMGMTVPAMFAKSSICFTPIIIIFSNQNILKKINSRQLFKYAPDGNKTEHSRSHSQANVNVTNTIQNLMTKDKNDEDSGEV
jgi:hypothetical protein